MLLAQTFASGQKSFTIFVEAAWMEVVMSAIDFVLADKLEKLLATPSRLVDHGVKVALTWSRIRASESLR